MIEKRKKSGEVNDETDGKEFEPNKKEKKEEEKSIIIITSEIVESE